MLGPALISRRLRRGAASPGVQQSLAAPPVNRALEALALGELIADKTSFIPSRLAPASLIGRALSGALVGMSSVPSRPQVGLFWRFLARGVRAKTTTRVTLLCAAMGAAAAMGTAVVTYRARRLLSERLGLSSGMAGVFEDGMVLWAASKIERTNR